MTLQDLWKHIDETTDESLYMPYIRHVFYKVALRRARKGGSFKQQTAAVLKKWDCALTRFRELADKQQQEKNPKLREVVQTFVSANISTSNRPAQHAPSTSDNTSHDPADHDLTNKNLSDNNLAKNFPINCSITSYISSMLSSFIFCAAMFFTVMVSAIMGCVANTHIVILSGASTNNNLSINLTGENCTDSEDKIDRYSDQVDADTGSDHVYIPEGDEPSASASWTDPLHGVNANLSADGEDPSGDRKATKPFDFRRHPLHYTAALMQQRAVEGPIKIDTETEQAVDRLYPGARRLRREDLVTLSPDRAGSDTYPAEHVASVHNLYIDLCRRKWVDTDGLVHGLLLSLFGREDVYTLGLDLQVNNRTHPSTYEDNMFPRAGRGRRYHVVPINLDENHFVVVIGDREEDRACLFDGYHQDDAGERDEVLRRIKEHYEAFLRVIELPKIELRYGRAPRQPKDDAVSCGLIALEVVRYVFRELGGDLATAEHEDFRLTGAVTSTVSRDPWAGGSDAELIKVLLQAWLLWLERELGGDGSSRVLTGELLDADEPWGAALPCVYKNGVRLGGRDLPTSKRVYFAAFPKDMVDHWTRECRTSRNFADDALVNSGLVTSKKNDERQEDFSQAYNEKYGQHDVSSLAQDDGDADLPTRHALDDLTGLPLADRGPYSLSADANLQYTISEDGGDTTLGRHTGTNLGAIATCTNWLLGSQFAYEDAAAAAQLLRRLHDLDTPWQQRKEEVQFALNCLDNLAAARQVDPCRVNDHAFENRCEVWKKQGQGELKESARFWARPEGGNEYMTELIDERMSREGVRQRAGVFFSLGLEVYYGTSGETFAHADGRKGEYTDLHNNMWAAAYAKGLSKREFEYFFMLHGVYFPFYTAARKYLPRPEDWTIAHLVALAREEAENGLKRCNGAAIAKGLGEGDLYEAKNWTRVIFPIFVRALDKLIEVKKELRGHWQSMGWALPGPGGWDDVFTDEVAHLLTDDMGAPIMPLKNHILRCTHEKRFDPRDIMLSGYQIGPNGMPFESAGPFTHPEDFHLMRSFNPRARTMLFSSNLTNMIRGQEHHSLWEGSRALLLSIPPDGPLSTLDKSLGEKPWAAADPEACRGTPPGPTFDIAMPLPSADDLVLHRHGSRRGVRLDCPSCQGAQSQDLTPGELLNHCLVVHSLLGGHRCRHCGLTCFDAECLKFHHLLCFRDPEHLQKAWSHYQRFGHHMDGDEGCPFQTGERRHYAEADLQHHRKTCGKSSLERLGGQFCCICGLAYQHRQASIVRHQSSEPHKKQMAYRNDPSTAGGLEPCQKCGILLGATPSTNKLHEKFCENIQMIKADPDKFKIVEDGAAARKDQDTMLKHFRAEAGRLASALMKEIAKHAPPEPLPEDGVCRICLQKLTSNHTSHKNAHKRSQTHTRAQDLLKRLYDDVPEDDEEPADKKRLSELLSDLQAVYHGQRALPSELLERLFIVHIPPGISNEDFCTLIIKNPHLTARFPPRWNKGSSTTMQRILDVRPKPKPGKLDCVDCCLFGLHENSSKAAISTHTSQIHHLGAHGLIDGMLELMAAGTSRFDAVLEVQRRYQDNDSDSDSSGKPPRKKPKLAAGSPQAKKATSKPTSQAKAASKPAAQAKKPARKPRGGRGRGKAATGKSAGVQAAGPDIRSFFKPVPKPDPASREDDGGDGEDDSDLMDLDK